MLRLARLVVAVAIGGCAGTAPPPAWTAADLDEGRAPPAAAIDDADGELTVPGVPPQHDPVRLALLTPAEASRTFEALGTSTARASVDARYDCAYALSCGTCELRGDVDARVVAAFLAAIVPGRSWSCLGPRCEIPIACEPAICGMSPESCGPGRMVPTSPDGTLAVELELRPVVRVVELRCD